MQIASTTMAVNSVSIHEMGVALEMLYTTITVSSCETSSTPSSATVVVEAWLGAGVLLIKAELETETGGVLAEEVTCAVLVSVTERLPPPHAQHAVLAL